MSLITQPLALDLSALSARKTLAPLARVAVKFAVVIVAWDEAYRSRQTLKSLTKDQLEDIGISHFDAQREARRPFWSS